MVAKQSSNLLVHETRIISFIMFLKIQQRQITILNTVFENMGFGF